MKWLNAVPKSGRATKAFETKDTNPRFVLFSKELGSKNRELPEKSEPENEWLLWIGVLFFIVAVIAVVLQTFPSK